MKDAACMRVHIQDIPRVAHITHNITYCIARSGTSRLLHLPGHVSTSLVSVEYAYILGVMVSLCLKTALFYSTPFCPTHSLCPPPETNIMDSDTTKAPRER